MISPNSAIRSVLLSTILISVILAGVLFGCGNESTIVNPAKDGVTHYMSIPPIDASAPAKTETATLALGCFWGPDSRFGSLDSVVRTRVGYAGGTTQTPTYYNLGDHTESVQIDYDPTQISYEQILDIYWDSHDPTIDSASRQYRSIIFYHSSQQQGLATETKQREEIRLGRKIYTEIVPVSEFHLAEYYHQKHYLQQEPELMKELVAIYPNPMDFIDSTAAARINGYVGGHGTREALQEQLSSFGLSPLAGERLLEIVR
jgi:peptide-methionine (S)-S-oxide reductase